MLLNRFPYALRLVFVVTVALFSSTCSQPESAKQQPTDLQVSESTVTFVAVGDMMISRGVARKIDGANDPLLPFSKMAELFKSTDFNFGNLESPISGKDQVIGKGLVFNMNTRHVTGLTTYNFKVLNLANNHALDQRLPGLQFTQKFLKEHGITYLGTGDNLDQAWEPKIFEVKGLKIGFIGVSYASFNDGGVGRNNYVARMEDTERLKKAISQLKSEADFIVVTMHAGVEYTRKPNAGQKEFAHTAIDSGADIVIGAHPHWVQVMEQYKGKYIFYSLGNFIFDQEWSQDTKEGLVLKIMLKGRRSTLTSNLGFVNEKLGKGIALGTRVEQIELIPVVVENYSTPRQANEAEAQKILSKAEMKEKIIKP